MWDAQKRMEDMGRQWQKVDFSNHGPTVEENRRELREALAYESKRRLPLKTKEIDENEIRKILGLPSKPAKK